MTGGGCREREDRACARALHDPRDDELVQVLRGAGRQPDRIVVLAPGAGETPGDGLPPVHALARALVASSPRRHTELLYVYAAGPEPEPGHRAMAGYLRALAKEDSRLAARTVGVTGPDAAAALRREFAAGTGATAPSCTGK